MELFPYSLVRIGGDSFDRFQTIRYQKSEQILQRIEQVKNALADKRLALCEELLEVMKGLGCKTGRNVVQNIRRNVYNDRKVRTKDVNKAIEVLPELSIQRLNEFLQSVEEYESLVAYGGSVFEEEALVQRMAFQKLLDSDALQKGLILSSRTLLNRVQSYKACLPENFRKKEFQNELSFTQYLTRIYAKTSPFSSFTNLSKMTLDNLDSQLYQIKGGRNEVQSHIRLNNHLLKYMLSLLQKYEKASIFLTVKVNPTVSKNSDSFQFLTNHENLEAFQELPSNALVDELLAIISSHKDGIRLNKLINVLAENVDADFSELHSYIKQLIEYGLLEYRFQVSGTDPNWDLKLIPELEFLSQQQVPHMLGLIEVLKTVRNISESYAMGSVSERKALNEQAYASLKNILFEIHEAAGLPSEERKSYDELMAKRVKQKAIVKKTAEMSKGNSVQSEISADVEFKHRHNTYFRFKPEQIFYEDTIRNIEVVFDQKEVTRLVNKLNALLKELRIFKGHTTDVIKMKDYFCQKYEAESEVGVLAFYQDFFKDVKVPEENEQINGCRNSENNNVELPTTDSLDDSDSKLSESPFLNQLKNHHQHNERVKKWYKLFKDQLNYVKSAEQVNITLEDVQKVNGQLSPQLKDEMKHSYGSFIQFFEKLDHDGSKRLGAFVNATFSGYGKMMSRFLHIFDEEFTHTIRERNSSLVADDQMLLENCDASFFNANLHPNLMPYEIWAPGSNNILPSQNQLPITDFVLKYDSEADELILKHIPSGKRAFVNDLGFQASSGRSQLFQLLDKFSHAEYLSTYPLLNQISSGSDAEEEKEIKMLPRVVFEDDIVLQRKTWIIKKDVIPCRNSFESDWAYYLHLSRWRTKNNIPEELFITISPKTYGSKANGQNYKKLTRDDYKPQYINFQNVMCINLFSKLLDKAPDQLKLVEMLPCSGDMIKINNEKYVTEFVLEWQS